MASWPRPFWQSVISIGYTHLRQVGPALSSGCNQNAGYRFSLLDEFGFHPLSPLPNARPRKTCSSIRFQILQHLSLRSRLYLWESLPLAPASKYTEPWLLLQPGPLKHPLSVLISEIVFRLEARSMICFSFKEVSIQKKLLRLHRKPFENLSATRSVRTLETF